MKYCSRYPDDDESYKITLNLAESVIKEDLVNNTQSLIMYDETGKKFWNKN